jgi:tetratricopeptide (TPR) repeat protein
MKGGGAFTSCMRQESSEELKRAFMSIEGWIDLRNYDEAANELHALPPKWKSTTSFIKAWIRIYEAQKAWTNVELMATTLNQQKPKDLFGISKLAESYFQQGRPIDAIAKLGEALLINDKGDYPLVRYNLARYFCAAGQLKEARECLRKAIQQDRSLKKKANEDPAFEKLWTEEQDGSK